MGLNIQWRFQEPIDFSNVLLKSLENKQKTYDNMAKNLGESIRNTHDYMLDREMADLMEENQRQKKHDDSNKEQMGKEIALVKQEIESLKIQREQLQNQLNELENPTPVEEEFEQSNSDYNPLFDTGRIEKKVPELGQLGGAEYGQF